MGHSLNKAVDRRGLLVRAAGAGALLAAATLPARALVVGRPPARVANVRDFGAAGDGSRNDTKAFERALHSSDTIYVPAGTYAVSRISIGAGKTIQTDGFATKFAQLAGLPSGTPIIEIIGSNVSIGSFAASGNIATDSGEWMNAVQIVANKTTGSLSNIAIADVYASGIRGDVLYLSAKPGYSLLNVQTGTIAGDNIFRNVVSITGTGLNGGNIGIAQISGTRVGLFHFDIEPDAGGTPAIGITVNSIKGRNVGINAQSADAYVDAVKIGSMDLSPAYSAGSSPDYPNTSYVRPHALQVRNTKSIAIGSFNAAGFDGQAIKYVESALTAMALTIDSCNLKACCRTESQYYAYVLGGGPRTNVAFGQITADLDRANTSLLVLCDGCAIGTISASLGATTRILNACNGASIDRLDVTGSGAGLAINSRNATIKGGGGAFDAIGYNCDELRFENMTLSGTFRGGSVDQEHIFENTVFNNIYYASEVYRPFG